MPARQAVRRRPQAATPQIAFASTAASGWPGTGLLARDLCRASSPWSTLRYRTWLTRHI